MKRRVKKIKPRAKAKAKKPKVEKLPAWRVKLDKEWEEFLEEFVRGYASSKPEDK